MKVWKNLVALGLVAALAGCQANTASNAGDGSAESDSNQGSSIQVVGSITVPPIYPVDPDGSLASGLDEPMQDGGECRASDGYSDIAEGGQVTVTNGTGDIIGIGRLEAGRQELPFEITYEEFLRQEQPICSFSFSFEVQKGEDFYSLSVGNGNRGEITYTEEEIGSGIFLTLGD